MLFEVRRSGEVMLSDVLVGNALFTIRGGSLKVYSAAGFVTLLLKIASASYP